MRLRRTFRGGVEFSASERQLYATNLWCRTVTRIVIRVARFSASTLGELAAGAAPVTWERWVPAGARPEVRVSCTSSRLYHTDAIAERLAQVAGTGDGTGPLLIARLMHDRVTLSVDSSGAPLFQRGWRLEGAKAPLRETLAAGLILASGWDGASPLIDPLCGSGTIAIEAALLGAGRPPGGGRPFGFQLWPSFQPGTWASVKAQPQPPQPQPTKPQPTKPGPQPRAGPTIVGRDRDAGAVHAATANAARAGVGDLVDLGHASLSDLEPPPGGPGWVVTNPPYGKRLTGGNVRDLYARFGDVVRARLADWTVALLVADPALASHTGLDLTPALRTDNGGIPVHLMISRPPHRRTPHRQPPHRQPPHHGPRPRQLS